MARKFTMRYKTAAGYETLYPKTIAEQVITDNKNRFISDEEKAAISQKIRDTFPGSFSELDDIAMCGGNFNNAAAGWCSFGFPREFDGVPAIHIQPVNLEGFVLVNNVTPHGFQYQVRTPMTNSATTAAAVELSYIAVYDGGIDN
jgi:hypothetical protein